MLGGGRARHEGATVRVAQMPIWIILSATAAYMAMLLVLASRCDTAATKAGFKQNPLVYALALSVYCTSWTYFGAVGTAASSGWDYLPIFLGPAIVFAFFPSVIRRIGDLAQRESITSLSDFLSSRYGKSRAVAALATTAAAAGSLPYIALQLKSVGMSFEALARGATQTTTQSAQDTVLFTAALLAGFAILFGARHADTARHNAGLMQLLAIESIVKLAALVAVAVLSFILMQSLPSGELQAAATQSLSTTTLSGRFITITLLSMAAIICLPRQFHVGVIERRSTGDVRTARWLFPSYLALTAAAVVPITLAGLTVLDTAVVPDLFVLALPMQQGNQALALIVFIGGFSAATGMVIVSTVTLSTMITNDLIVPGLMKTGRFGSFVGEAGRGLIAIRRTVIILLMLLAYLYLQFAGGDEALAQIGLLAFVAAAQFVPALLGGIYWRSGKAIGVLAGLTTGSIFWTYTLFLPAVFGHESLASAVPQWLDPYALFGLTFTDPLTHGVVLSLGANVAAFVFFSATARERLRDRIQAAAFAGDQGEERIAPAAAAALRSKGTNATPDGLKALASRFLSADAVAHAFNRFSLDTGVPASGDAPADWRLVQRTERLLASALGASSARVVMSSAVGGTDVDLSDVLSILDHKTQAERFDRHMLQSMLEHISQGISVVDGNQQLVAWNSAYVELFDYPQELIKVGQKIEVLIRHNIERGWIDATAPADEASRRVEHMRAGKPHGFERRIPDGRYIRITGNPMPGGGYLTSFTDITEDRLREEALIEANETLEDRVNRRTQALRQMALDLDASRREAEGANASKTRFLAAASHDLMQPLNAARLFLGAIDEKNTDAALVEKADRAIQSADALLTGLLDISRLDHSNVVANPVPLPLGPLMEDLADEAVPMAEKAGLALNLIPTRLSVIADPDFLQSILRNFLSNARRYTTSGRIVFGARRAGSDGVRIEVWDTGPGIPGDRQALMFEEFQRLEAADNMGQRGAGLGLSVAKRMAGLMGADIAVKSIVGKGSVFSVTLPRANAAEPAASLTMPQPNAAAYALEGRHILCIDDEPSILEGMRAMFTRWGCTVSTALSPDEARAHLSSDVDAVIADYDLNTDETGLDLLVASRTEITDPGHICLVTASDGQEMLRRARQLQIPVFKKPVDPEQIKRFLTSDPTISQAAE